MEVQHQEILQTTWEIDTIRANPRYQALILMSRQANERREYEIYCNKMKMYQTKIDRIKDSFPNNYGKTYDQFLHEKQVSSIKSSSPPLDWTDFEQSRPEIKNAVCDTMIAETPNSEQNTENHELDTSNHFSGIKELEVETENPEKIEKNFDDFE